MRILVACEYSGRVREAFRAKGHEAWSCDLLDSEDNSEWHYKGDCFDLINNQKWDLMIVHPPCTYLASSGLHWNKRVQGRDKLTEEALEFVESLLNCNIPKIALENPIGCISTRIKKQDQIIQPYDFGEDASKKTCLWLKNLPLLKANAERFPPRIVNGKERWSNQYDSGQNATTGAKDRWKNRSRTYQGIANAMAAQWG